MLERADTSLEAVIRVLAERGVEAGFLVPTATGLTKSIMDAHGQLREYFREVGIHDYSAQGKGPDARVHRRAWLVGSGEMVPTSVSLYRPETKEGDPRVWISGLRRYASAGNLLVILTYENELYVVNASKQAFFTDLDDAFSPLGGIVEAIVRAKGVIAQELLLRLRAIAKKGFIRTGRPGDTGVGMTLETELGIAANSSSLPDYRGIELKASRVMPRQSRQNRVTLFSKVPDWERSRVTSALALLREYGYLRPGETQRRLYCTVASRRNAQGLLLDVDGEILHVVHRGHRDRDVVQWGLPSLQGVLAQKHRETFWVKAEARVREGVEEFRYVTAIHTQAPIVTNLSALFASGSVQVDFLLKQQGLGVRDHGYLFRMFPRDLPLLFPPARSYDLS